MTGYLLAIDQGNTHTRAVVANRQGELLSLGLAAGASHAHVGMDKAMKSIAEAANVALQDAGVRSEQLELIFAGITGADWVDEFPLLENNIRQLGLCPEVKVVNDTIIALRAGTDRPYGAILILGSGGNCAVRAPDGREFIYGYYQEWPLQGADGLGRRVLEAIYRSYTGRLPETRLLEAALKAFQASTVDDLLRLDVEGRLPAAGIRDLAVVLFEAGYAGDVVANQVIRHFAEGCAGLVTAALRRFDMTGLALEVVLSGGIFKAKGSLLFETLSAGIHAAAPQACLVFARYEPVVGAVLLGLEHLGLQISAPVGGKVDEGAQYFNLVALQTCPRGIDQFINIED